MKTLSAQLEADAAERLVLAPGESFERALPRFKAFLKEHTGDLRKRHREGAGGLEIARALNTVTDVAMKAILRALWPAGRALEDVPLALVATGGYGRGELNPFSDIDFMLLDGGNLMPNEAARPYGPVPGAFIRAMHDVGLIPGESAVRTVDECVRLANKEMEAKTALLEARLVLGDAKLFQAFRQALLNKSVRGQEDAYITARLEDQFARRTKYGNSARMQEPNLKNGCGGLRDFQNLLWMAFVKYRTWTLADLEARELIDATERRDLEAAYDYLIRARTELHLQAGRAVETLSAQYQPQVASVLGYRNGSARANTEKFMKDVYTHARNIHLITRSIEERLALEPKSNPGLLARLGRALPRPRLAFRKQPPQEFDGFIIEGAQLRLAHRRGLRDAPPRLMRAFRIAQQRGLTLHPDLTQIMRQQTLSLVDADFRTDTHVRTAFLEILDSPGNVAPALRAMHEVGLLGAYLPEFGALTNLVQHEFFHRFATDEHTLVCIDKLDSLATNREPALERFAELYRQLDRHWLLYFALLMHDVGKAVDTPNHCEIGGELVLKAARRLDLDGAATHTLRLIIEQHLTMPKVWQKRDLDDPSVIRTFCGVVQSREHLDLLTLHTLADSLGTSEDMWKDYHITQHWVLYHKAASYFRGGEASLVEVKERELLRTEVRAQLPKTFDEAEVDAHFHTLPPRYFQIHDAPDIARDVVLAHQFMHLQLITADRALEPVVHWQDRRLPFTKEKAGQNLEKDRGYAMVHICTWDRAGLFAKITGALAAASLNIFGAQIFTRDDGIVLDEFYVADARTGELPSREAREKFEKLLRQVLAGDFDLAPAIGKTKRLRPLWQGLAGDTIETEIRFDNHSSFEQTIIEIVTEDRVGLLYVISQTLNELELDLKLAKILTEKGAAQDSFYVTERDGGKVTDPGRQRWIEQRLCQAIGKLAA